MAVNLSPVAGAAAQFFDNSGNVLTGGKLYTYDAGTTTPAPTYTSSNGVTAHPNPIILNAAGRVPDSGEIWLADSVSYKFVLKDQNDVLIGTYDNLVGINSNFVNFTGEEETQTATQGQTVFTLTTLNYQPAVNNLLVFVNGSKQISGVNYQETSSTVITFVDGLNVGDVVDFSTATPINTNAVAAAQVSYEPGVDSLFTTQNNVQIALDAISDKVTGANYVGFNVGETGSINRTVTSKLKDFVSVKDFGAKGDGTTDDAAALRAAFTAWADAATADTPFKLYVPAGIYKIGSKIDLRTMFLAQGYYSLDFEMSAGAVFSPITALNPMLDWSCPEGGGFSFCNFKFGQIGGGLLTGVNNGVIIRNTSDSTISFQSLTAWANSTNGVGLNFICSTATGIYNNLITIGALLSNKYGIICSDTTTPPHGFQGNLITIGHCGFNEIAIWLLNQSTSNTFTIGSLEGNTSKAILDQAGYNIYKINFSDESAGNEIELGTANGRVDIEGYGLLINNTGNAYGWVKDNNVPVTPLVPTMPASNVPYRNLFERPTTVTISGGTSVSIYMGGVLLGSSGSFRVPYGYGITIIYVSAPSWVWTFD